MLACKVCSSRKIEGIHPFYNCDVQRTDKLRANHHQYFEGEDPGFKGFALCNLYF
jgi:hypothetical protein